MYLFMLQKIHHIAVWQRGEPDDNPTFSKRRIQYLNTRALDGLVLPFCGVVGGATSSQQQSAGREDECDCVFHGVFLWCVLLA
jgi:hypothetical protein